MSLPLPQGCAALAGAGRQCRSIFNTCFARAEHQENNIHCKLERQAAQAHKKHVKFNAALITRSIVRKLRGETRRVKHTRQALALARPSRAGCYTYRREEKVRGQPMSTETLISDGAGCHMTWSCTNRGEQQAHGQPTGTGATRTNNDLP